MTLEDFRRLADTWGGDIERWPEAERAAARRLAASPQTAEFLKSAARLDALVAERPQVSRERARRAAHAVTMRVAAEGHRQDKARRRWDFSSWFVPAVSVTCSALIGISLAVAFPSGDAQEPVVLSMILDSGSMAAGWALQ